MPHRVSHRVSLQCRFQARNGDDPATVSTVHVRGIVHLSRNHRHPCDLSRIPFHQNCGNTPKERGFERSLATAAHQTHSSENCSQASKAAEVMLTHPGFYFITRTLLSTPHIPFRSRLRKSVRQPG